MLANSIPAASQPDPVYAWTNFAGLSGDCGSVDGSGSEARFDDPSSIAVDRAGSVYVTDCKNHTIRKVSVAGMVTTLAGSARSGGSADGKGKEARFLYPQGIAVDRAGNVFVADCNNHTIRKVSAAGMVTTLAGSARSGGNVDGEGGAARFLYPRGLAVDKAGNVYVADSWNQSIRKVSTQGIVTTLARGFMNPTGVAVDGKGNVYVVDAYDHTIQKVSAVGVVTRMAGSADSHASGDGTNSAALFGFPSGVAVDGTGNLYVTETENHAIWKVNTAGLVPPLGRTFKNPVSVAVDSAGNLFVADSENNLITKGIRSTGEPTQDPKSSHY